MSENYGIVDLFAGPGGLGEGFCEYRNAKGKRPFEIVLSAEMDPAAHQTLLLRAFLRQFPGKYPEEYSNFMAGKTNPDWAALYPVNWQKASNEAQCLTLGTQKATKIVNKAIDTAKEKYGSNTIVIGGPPCQAYSIVGRARNKGISGYKAENDHRHFLFKEYIRVLKRLKPAVFVMENVKGILSSKVGNQGIFRQLMQDLSSLGGSRSPLYEIVPIYPNTDQSDLFEQPLPSDFIVRSELFGIPQTRHRVILVGVRKDFSNTSLMRSLADQLVLPSKNAVPIEHVISDLPILRSGLSKLEDTPELWKKTVLRGMKNVEKSILKHTDTSPEILSLAKSCIRKFEKNNPPPRSTTARKKSISSQATEELRRWITDSDYGAIANHETRGHTEKDLERYFFAALYGKANGSSPSSVNFPPELWPDHANWETGKFADRFRVQVYGRPATTVTSHISKDGHYFIHPDPLQCRSLTVREAARIQTFPDNYMFMGSRTEQYIQVGNAVPPLLANKIARIIYVLLNPVKPKRKKSKTLKNILV